MTGEPLTIDLCLAVKPGDILIHNNRFGMIGYYLVLSTTVAHPHQYGLYNLKTKKPLVFYWSSLTSFTNFSFVSL